VTWALTRRLWWRALFALTGGLSVVGRRPVGPCVIVANHCSHADAPALVAALPARLRPAVAAADDYWFRRPVRRRVCVAAVGAFPVRRGGGGSADLDGAAALLRAGRSVVVLPEGTRSRTGELGRFHSGAMRLAATAGVPVVPVGLIGTGRLLPVHGRPRAAQVTVRFGKPIPRADAAAARDAVVALLDAGAAAADSPLRQRVAGFASSRWALVVVAAWAVAEALSWPLVPEFVLGLLLLARIPWRRAAALVAAALVGTVVGCTLAVSLAGAGLAAPALLTTPRMHVVAAGQLAREGVAGVRHQPWSGIPLKVYAVEEGRHQPQLLMFALTAMKVRAMRFVEVTLALGGLARLLPRRCYAAVSLTAVTVFAAGLTQVVAHWS
jgi:1-acyl-sn-glycerol-3-phosphate acyltransferase